MYSTPKSFFRAYNLFNIENVFREPSSMKNIEYSKSKIYPLNSEQIDYYTDELYHLFAPYWRENLNYLRNRIGGYIQFGYSTNLGDVSDIPPPVMLPNYLHIDVPEYVIKNLVKIHFDIVKTVLGQLDEYTYNPSTIRSINNFVYAIFCQGRNQMAYEMEYVLFYNDMTPNNTFYIDISPQFNPDTISDLTKPDSILIYNGQPVPFEQFEVITMKGCGWEGGSVYRENLFGVNSNRILFQNLYKYLTANGIIQITPAADILLDGINFNNISDLYNVIYDDTINSALLFKLG